MRVAVVGLGDIAGKAYLPVLTADPSVVPVLVTRDPDTRAGLAAAHRAEVHADVDAALRAGVDAAFVTAATVAHVPLVSGLIEAGVPTHVEKPLADNLADARTLVELAERRRVGLAVGFNRRHAPAYAAVAGWPERDVAVLHKHRHDLPGEPRRVVFDDFVHVLDTLRFLVTPEPDGVDVSARVVGGRLHRVAVTLRQGNRIGIGVMDRDSGTTQEVLEVLAPGRRTRIVELTEVTRYEGGREVRATADGWAPTAVRRGFAAMCAAFLQAVREGRRLVPDDALRTHALAEQVLAEVERA